MPTTFETRKGMSDPTTHTIQESVYDFARGVNAALTSREKFVTVTGADGKLYAVEATEVSNIIEA